MTEGSGLDITTEVLSTQENTDNTTEVPTTQGDTDNTTETTTTQGGITTTKANAATSSRTSLYTVLFIAYTSSLPMQTFFTNSYN